MATTVDVTGLEMKLEPEIRLEELELYESMLGKKIEFYPKQDYEDFSTVLCNDDIYEGTFDLINHQLHVQFVDARGIKTHMRYMTFEEVAHVLKVVA